MTPALLTVEDVAERLGVSRRTAYRLARRMLRVDLGRTIRVTEAALAKFLEERSAASTATLTPPSPAFDAVDFAAFAERIRQATSRIDRKCPTEGRWPGYTYAIRHGETGLIKIGHASDPVSRLLDIQHMSPVPLALVGLCHVSNIEADLHREFASCRRHGEWFEFPSIIVGPIPRLGGRCFGCRRYTPT